MLIIFDESEEFLKFVSECSEHRYRLYYNSKNKSYIVRPSKTSKGLDTAVFTGVLEDNIIKLLDSKFEIIKVLDFIISRD